MTDIEGIAIGIPAHNEAERIDRALASVIAAAETCTVPVVIVVGADACDDGTATLARRRFHRLPKHVVAQVIEFDARQAGVARERACRAADARLRAWVGRNARRWIATTDADTAVAPDWLSVHREWFRRGVDAVAGLVRVDPEDELRAEVRHHLDGERIRAGLGHGHVFGANLGVEATWFARVGGFPAVSVGEDVLLVARLREAGAQVVGVPDSVVLTSGRLTPRAPGGFGTKLAALTLECDDQTTMTEACPVGATSRRA